QMSGTPIRVPTADPGVQSPAISRHPSSLLDRCAALVSGLVCLVISNVFAIIFIVIGAVNVDNCPVQPMIPIYLIVTGALAILNSALKYYVDWRTMQAKPYKYELPIAISVFFVISGLFGLVWLIFGMVWTFGANPGYETASPRYCDYWTYMVSYVNFIMLFALLAASCCCCVCTVAGATALAIGERERTQR
ncbi:hypothetical protein PFISCL1PPCAC_28798, partial [Pristionchus fissidentatus]